MAEEIGAIKAELLLSTAQFNKRLTEAEAKLDALGKHAQNTAHDLKGIQIASGIVSAAVAASIGGAVALAANFQQKMADIKAISGANNDEMKTLSDLAVKMGAKTKYSADESAQGIEELIKAGVSLTDIVHGGLEGALNLATAGNLDLAKAAEIASTALNAFRDDNLSVSQAANILAGAANASATDVEQMQMGLSQVAAVASGAGLSFKDTATALAVFAQNGLKGSDAGTSLKTMLLRLQPTTKKAAGEMMSLGLITKKGGNAFYDAHGNLKSFAEMSQILHDKLSGLTSAQREAALQIMFGTDAIRSANIMFKSGAKDVNAMWDAMSNVTAADVAATKMDTLKGDFEQFKGALETLGITIGEEFLPSFRQIVKDAEGVVHWFGKLNPAIITTDLKAAGAAAGVALIASSVMRLYRASRLITFTPTGMVITGLALLTGAIVGAIEAHKQLTEVNLDTANSMMDSYAANKKMIDQYDQLRTQSHLTNKEFADYLDLQTKISQTSDPQKIKDYKKAMDDLQKKSGLSNDHFEHMLDLNKKITDNVPKATGTITDQGNRIADTTDKLKEYNAQLAEATVRQLIEQRIKALKEHEKLQSEIAKKEKTYQLDLKIEDSIRQKLRNYDQQAVDAKIKQLQTEIKMSPWAKERNRGLQNQIEMLREGKQGLQEQLGKIMEQNDQTGKQLDDLKKKDDKLRIINEKLKTMYLESAGISAEEATQNAKSGTAIKLIDAQISKLGDKKAQMIKTTPIAQRHTREFQQQVGKIDAQIAKLKDARSNIIENTDAAKHYTDELGRDVTKYVNVHYTETGGYIARSAPHLARHQGGVLPKRHEGGALRKLHGGGWNPPLSTEVDVRILRNEMVLTEAQQSSLFRLLNQTVPSAGATSGVTSQDISALVEAIRNADDSRPISLALNINGREFAQATGDDLRRYIVEKERRERAASGIVD